MRRVFGIFAAVTGSFLGCVPLAFGSPVAYLASPVNSTTGLVSAAQADPVVLGRYARHFGMSQEAVLKYLASLRFELLPAVGTYPVFAPDETAPSAKLAILPKGEPVFAERSGRVILRASDGAALAASEEGDSPFGGFSASGDVTPGDVAGASGTPNMAGTNPGATASVVPVSSDDAMEWGDGVSLSEPLSLDDSQNSDAAENYGPALSQVADAGTSPYVADPSEDNLLDSYLAQAPAPDGSVAGTVGSGATALGVLTGLGLTFALLDHSSSHASSQHAPLVPEPAPVLVLGSGLTILAARRRSANRSQK